MKKTLEDDNTVVTNRTPKRRTTQRSCKDSRDLVERLVSQALSLCSLKYIGKKQSTWNQCCHTEWIKMN